jgi:hypothetical protein
MWPWILAGVLLLALVILILLVLLLRRSAKQTEFVDAEEPEEEETKEAATVDERPAETIPSAFRRAAKYIDRVADGDRKNVPLLLLVGNRGSRDSDLLAHAGLDLTWGTPEEAETSLGEGRGFWIFDRGVVLDAAGEEAGWDAIVAQLQRLRPKRPIDGVIVTLSCAELLEAATSEVKRSELAGRAAKLYRTLWDAQQRLGFRLPTYVVVTGCERVTGFTTLATSLREPARGQMLGWSNPNGVDAVYRATWVDDAFAGLAARLGDVTMEVFTEGTTEGDQLVRLPAVIPSLAASLRATLDTLFKSSAYHGTLIFRGLYFCGRETPPPMDDTPPSGRVAFLAELLERKIFAEHRLASPTARTVVARNRTVSVVKSIAAGLFFLTLLSLGWVAFKFSRQNATLEPVLSNAAEAMERNAPGTPSTDALRKEAMALLTGMATINFNDYDSLVVPASWFNPFQEELEHAFREAFHDIILRAIRADLKSRSRRLVPLDEGVVVPYGDTPDETAETAVPASMASGVMVGEAPPPWIDQRVSTIASMPEFQALRAYAAQLKELDDQIKTFNKLHDTGDLRQVGALVNFSYGIVMPETFYRKSHLYRRALMAAEYKKLLPDAQFRDGAARKLTRLVDAFHETLFHRNPFTARLQRLSFTIRDVTWQPPASGDTTPLQSISDQLKRIEADLSGPELAWAFEREFDLGPDYKSLLGDLGSTSYFGEDVAERLRTETATLWTRFQQGLTWMSSPLTKTILAVHEDRPEMQLSKESLLLQSALQTFLGQSFVAAGRRGAQIRTELPDGFRLNWNTEALDQAVAVAQAYDRFRGGTLMLFPPDVRASIEQVARERAVAEMLDAIARARIEEPVEYVDSPSEREEQIRLDVIRFNAMVPALETVLEASSRLSPGAGRLVAAAMSAEAYRMLASIDGLIDRDKPYATMEEIAQWDGGVPPSPRVWGKSDDAELGAWLEATRGRIAYVAMNYAKPPLAWLTKANAATRPGTRELVASWQAIIDDVRDHDAKKPGNSIAVLEDYIGVRMAKVTANDCTAAGLPSGFRVRSFFGQTALDLSRRVRQRCLELAGRGVTSRYVVIERYFNQRLAGRYPFSERIPRAADAEADPNDLRTFFRIFDENKAALAAPAAQGGLDPAQEAQRKFIDDMAAVRVFFATFLDAPKPDLAPSFDVEATFRVLKASEIDGQQIIGWSLAAGDDAITNRQASKKLRWTAGQPLRIALRWAADSPRVPVISGEPRASLDGDRRVVWTYKNRWSLLAALADHPVRGEELPGYADLLPVTLAFNVATKPAGAASAETTPARVFMRLALLAPGTNQPLDVPRFPVRAPRLEATKEASR